jgi:hypothetical protein
MAIAIPRDEGTFLVGYIRGVGMARLCLHHTVLTCLPNSA